MSPIFNTFIIIQTAHCGNFRLILRFFETVYFYIFRNVNIQNIYRLYYTSLYFKYIKSKKIKQDKTYTKHSQILALQNFLFIFNLKETYLLLIRESVKIAENFVHLVHHAVLFAFTVENIH